MLPIEDLEFVKACRDDPRAHTFIKASRSLNVQEPIIKEVREHLIFKGYSRIYDEHYHFC